MKRAQSAPIFTIRAKRRESDLSARSTRSYTQPSKSDLPSTDVRASTPSSSRTRCGQHLNQLTKHLISYRTTLGQQSSIQGEQQRAPRQSTPARRLATQLQSTKRDPKAFQDLATAALRIVEQHFAIPHVQTRPRQQQVQEQQGRRQIREVPHVDYYEPGWHLEELADGDSYSDEDHKQEDVYEAEPGVVYTSRETEWGYTMPVVIELPDDDEHERETPVEDRAAWLRAIR